MRAKNIQIVLFSLSSLLLLACDGQGGGGPTGPDAGSPEAGPPGDPSFLASCYYENSFARASECREYRGAGWSEESAASTCADVFFGMAGELRLGEACAFEQTVGRCTVGDLESDGYVIVSSGDPSSCGAAQTGCETFAGGAFDPDPACDACAATGTEGPGAVVPTTPDCRAPLPGEPPGTSDGQVCTFSLISASTEPGRHFADYADCDVVRSQRPYYGARPEVTMDPRDPRLGDEGYMGELAWVREQAAASACVCCHAESVTPSGAAAWDIEAGPLWIDTVSDEALAMFAGFTDSAAFGYLPAEENNGFDRSISGLPTTDLPRLQAFAERELGRRGLSVEEARTLPAFAPFFRDLIEHRPEPCEEGIGIDAEGGIRWTGGGARYLWILEPDSLSPGAPPNWDLPEGTLWAIRTEHDAPAMGCGMAFGEASGEGVIQRFPAEGAPAPLVSGRQYYLAVMRDIAQPITRCLFTAP